MYSPKTILLIAPCGMNCSFCYAYLREKNKCTGCRASDENKTKSIVNCKIRNCVNLNSEFCYICKVLPCEKLKNLDKRYRTKYNMSMIKNLEMIRGKGIRNFISDEKEKWTCHECKGIISIHTGCCMNCGKEKFKVLSNKQKR